MITRTVDRSSVPGTHIDRTGDHERPPPRGSAAASGAGHLTVESQPYFDEDVEFGDEVFCTTTDFTGSSGVLVRRGDTLIYVSLTSGGIPRSTPPPPATAPSSSPTTTPTAIAQKLADKVR